MLFADRNIVVTGGTGSLGQVLVRRLLEGKLGIPNKIIIFSRDEAKQYALRAEYQMAERTLRARFNDVVSFVVGDVRDFHSVSAVLRQQLLPIVFNTAALKQVPTCEYFPFEAVRTNIEGAENIVRAIESGIRVNTVIGISTDKACKPVNVMGMTKAIQERIFLNGNIRALGQTRFVCVRYGNVLASRGSVIPLFQDQIKNGGPVTITTKEMTRFLLSLDEAVDLVFNAMQFARPGETFIPRVPSARMYDVAKALVGNRDIEIKETGIRPGEKTHEVLVSEEEAARTEIRGPHYVIASHLPELPKVTPHMTIKGEYSSVDDILSYDGVVNLLRKHNFIA